MRNLLALLVVLAFAVPAAEARTRSYSWGYRGPANGLRNFIVTQGNTFYGYGYSGYERNVSPWDVPPAWGASNYAPGGAYYGPQNYNYGGYGGNVWYSQSNADLDAPIRELPPPLIIENPYYTGKTIPMLQGRYRRQQYEEPEVDNTPAKGTWEPAGGLDYAN